MGAQQIRFQKGTESARAPVFRLRCDVASTFVTASSLDSVDDFDAKRTCEQNKNFLLFFRCDDVRRGGIRKLQLHDIVYDARFCSFFIFFARRFRIAAAEIRRGSFFDRNASAARGARDTRQDKNKTAAEAAVQSLPDFEKYQAPSLRTLALSRETFRAAVLR